MAFRRLRLIILAAVLAAAGCGVHPEPTAALRAQSLTQLPLESGARDWLQQRLINRTVILIHGKKGEFSTQWNSHQDAIAGGETRASGTLVSADGYFLTAAHCLHPDLELSVLYVRPGKGYVLAKAADVRVVWKGEPGFYTLKDLALLKLNIQGVDFFDWSPPTLADKGAPFTAAGACLLDNGFISAAAGKVVNPVRGTGKIEGQRTTWMELDGPLGRGDSGGPIADVYGNLLAIYTSYDYWYGLRASGAWGFPTIRHFALRPDPQWLEAVIQRDRAAHPEAPAATATH